MRRQPKAIHRIRKILTAQGKKAQVTNPLDESLADSFTSSEKKAVLEATADYNHAHFGYQHYADEMSIEEFIGRPKVRRFKSIPPVMKYGEDVNDRASGKRTVRRSASVDSATKTGSSVGVGSSLSNITFKEGGLEKGNRVSNGRDSLHMDAECQVKGKDEISTVTNGASALDVYEVFVDSNPLIEERTGFEGDTPLPFFTPSSSLGEDGVDDNGDHHGGSEDLAVDARVSCQNGHCVLGNGSVGGAGGYRVRSDVDDKADKENFTVPGSNLPSLEHDLKHISITAEQGQELPS